MNISPQYRERSQAAEQAFLQVFRFENESAPYLIYDASYWLFGNLQEQIPIDYCDDDPASMIRFQIDGIERHVAQYDDAYIPFLMPWYGTGVLASGFGVDIIFQDYMDPAVDLAPIEQVEKIKGLKKPDPHTDGLMPRVMNTIARMRQASDLPVGVTDCQGPLTTALQIVGYERAIYWMTDHPQAMHELMQRVTGALIDWVRVQKKAAGQSMEDDAYVLGVKIPHGFGGVWMSDDDCVIFGPDLYREFVVPYNSQVLKAFGGGAIHYCGTATQHIDNYLATEGLSAIHNLNLDQLDEAAKMRHALEEEPDLIHALLDYARRVATRYAFALMECGGRSTSIGEPLAGPDLLSPAHYKKYPWQHEKKMVDELKAHGVILHNHICGNTIPIVDDFIATGAQVLEIDHKTDVAQLKEHARNKTSLLANLDTNLLNSGTPTEVEEAARQAIEVMAPDYGFILGPGCAMGTHTPAENIHALVESAKKYGAYK